MLPIPTQAYYRKVSYITWVVVGRGRRPTVEAQRPVQSLFTAGFHSRNCTKVMPACVLML